MQATCFTLEAVDLGDLHSVLIGFNGEDATRWKVAKVYVKLDERIDVFVCGRTLGKGEKDKRTEFVIFKDEEASVDVPESVFEDISQGGIVNEAKPADQPKPKPAASKSKAPKPAAKNAKASKKGTETPKDLPPPASSTPSRPKSKAKG